MNKLPFVAFAWQHADLFDRFFEKHWRSRMYHDFDTWSILESELYDFTG